MVLYLKLIWTAVFWGGTFIAGRVVAQDLDPFAAAFLRFLIASILLLILTKHVEGRFPRLQRQEILPVVLLGATGVFAYNVLFFRGLHSVSAGRASLLIATNPIFISLFSAYLFHERLTRRNVIGIGLSVVGAAVVITRGDLVGVMEQGLSRGDIYILGCVATWVVYSLIGKGVMDYLSPLASVAYSSAVGTVGLFFPALSRGVLAQLGSYSWLHWLSLAYLAVFGTVLGFLWYYEGIREIGPSRASIFINFVPISALVLAALLLDEPITTSLLAGAALVSFGVYLTTRRNRRQK